MTFLQHIFFSFPTERLMKFGKSNSFPGLQAGQSYTCTFPAKPHCCNTCRMWLGFVSADVPESDAYFGWKRCVHRSYPYHGHLHPHVPSHILLLKPAVGIIWRGRFLFSLEGRDIHGSQKQTEMWTLQTTAHISMLHKSVSEPRDVGAGSGYCWFMAFALLSQVSTCIWRCSDDLFTGSFLCCEVPSPLSSTIHIIMLVFEIQDPGPQTSSGPVQRQIVFFYLVIIFMLSYTQLASGSFINWTQVPPASPSPSFC